MANPEIVNFSTEDGVRAVDTSEQALLTSAAADTVAKLTILGRVTATGKYAFYNVANTPAGTGTPVAVLLNEVVAAAAGDNAASIMLEGKVRADKLVIDGSAAGVGITPAIKDSLRTYGIIVESAEECSALDNQ